MFTRVEAVAMSLVAFAAAAIVAAYLVGALGLTLHPAAILLLATAASASALVALWRHTTTAPEEAAAFVVIVAGVLSWLLWLASPHFLPVGSGPDLTHHLVLIDFIERTGHVVRDATLASRLGEMVDYTPGSHLFVVLAGRWIGSDGLHAAHTVIALCVALKTGLLFLIAVRCLPADRARTPFAIVAPLLLFLPRAYFVGSFAQNWFLAQVVSELFAVAMWWAIVAWDQQVSPAAAAMFALAGAAAFLSWPVWVGPPIAAFAAIALPRPAIPFDVKLRHMALAVAPIAGVALVHASRHLGAAAIVRTSGAVIAPTPATLGWPFIVLSAVGLLIAAFDRRARTVVLLTGAIAIQATVLAGVARSGHAATPYLALKMWYLAIYPLAVAGAVAARRALHAAGPRVAWTVVVAAGIIVARSAIAMPRPTPVVSDPMYDAGRWARANLPPACVDYLVNDDDSAYWLHLAVLGNARSAPRSLNSDTYEPKQALVRWVLPGGLPYAIVGALDDLPTDIRTSVDVLGRFGPAAVVKRRGASSCDAR